jgi:hypothetical protein
MSRLFIRVDHFSVCSSVIVSFFDLWSFVFGCLSALYNFYFPKVCMPFTLVWQFSLAPIGFFQYCCRNVYHFIVYKVIHFTISFIKMSPNRSSFNKILSDRVRFNILRRSTRSKSSHNSDSCKDCPSKNEYIQSLFNYVEFLEQSNSLLLQRLNVDSSDNSFPGYTSNLITPQAVIDLVPDIIKAPPSCPLPREDFIPLDCSSDSDSHSSYDSFNSSNPTMSSSHVSSYDNSSSLSNFYVNISDVSSSNDFVPPPGFCVSFSSYNSPES